MNESNISNTTVYKNFKSKRLLSSAWKFKKYVNKTNEISKKKLAIVIIPQYVTEVCSKIEPKKVTHVFFLDKNEVYVYLSDEKTIKSFSEHTKLI